MVKKQINKSVDYTPVILDNRIPFKLVQTSEGENVIYCKSFKDQLFDSGFFSTKDKDFVHNYITENNQKYIITDVTTPDNKIYKNIKFKIVVDEKAETPYSTFNPNETISEKKEYKLPENKPLITEKVEPKKQIEIKPEIVVPIVENKKEENYLKTTESDLCTPVILDGRVPFRLIQTNEGESVIFCKSFKDELLDSGLFSTKDKDFVHNYVVEKGQKYIITDVTTPDDKVYKNIKFRVVVNENEETPHSIFNPEGVITENSEYKLPENQQPLIETTQFKETEPTQIDLTENYKLKKQEDEYFEKAKELQKKLIEEKTNLEQERKELEKQRIHAESEKVVAEKLNDYKQLILQEFFDVSEKQEKIIKNKLDENCKLLENKIQEQTKIQSENSKSALDQLNEKNLRELKKEIGIKIDEKQKEIEKLIEIKTENSVGLLVEKADDLKKLFDEKLVLDLQNYKQTLYSEILKISDENTNDFLVKNKENLKKEIKDFFKEERLKVEKDFYDGIESVKQILEKTSEDLNSKTPELDKKLKTINEKLQELTEQKKNNQVLIGEAKTYTDKEIKKAFEESKNFARRILELGGGGGTNAVQYAKGGTMDGNLNVTGNYLSAGVNLLNIFTGGGGGDPAVNALVHSNSANWNAAYTNLIYNSASYLSAYNMSLINSNSAYWNTAYTNLVSNSSNYLSGASLNYVNTTFVKISGDTMTGTLSVAPAAYVLSPSFATFVKNNDYPSLSATLRQNYDFYNSDATFAVPGGIIIKGQSPSYDTSIRNLPGLGVYGMWIQNVDNMDPGTTFVSDGRAQVTHAMSFRAGIANFTAGSDHNHVLWQGAPSNPTQNWQMSNGGNNTNGPQGYLTNRFFLHTLPQYQISTAITTQNNGYVDTRNAFLLTGTDRLTGVEIGINLPAGTNNYHLVSPGVVVGIQINPAVAGLVAVTYQSQCTSVSANASLSTFKFDLFLGNTANWNPSQAAIQTVNLSARSVGGNPGINLITSQIGTPATHYVGLTGNYLNLPKHCLARFTTNNVLTGLKTGSPLTLWIPQNMPSNAPGGTGFVTSETNTGPTGTFRYGYFDAFVRSVSGTDLEFVIGNLMDTYGFQNRTWSLTASGTAGWVIYGGSQDTVHRPTFGTTDFYFEREPYLFTSSDNFSFLSGGMVKNVVFGTSESYGRQSYGLGFRGVVMGDRSGVFAGDGNIVYGDYSVALGGIGLISLSSTPYQAVFGKYNNPNNNALMVVGNGSSDTNRSNIIEISNSSVSVSGFVYVSGGISSSGGLSAANINLVNSTVITPLSVSDTGQFLILNINGNNKAIRLWDYAT